MDLLFTYWSEIVIMIALVLLMYRRPLLSLTNLTTTYWVFMVIAGLLLYPISSTLVRFVDDELLTDSVRLYAIALACFAAGVFMVRVMNGYARTDQRSASTVSSERTTMRIVFPWIITVVSGLAILITFRNVGYIPLLTGETHVTKYFQADLDVFTKYRPIYTFALNALSSVLVFALAALFHARKKRNWILLTAVTMAIILLTAKRGPLLLPVIYVGLAYSIWKQKVKPVVFSVLAVVVAGVVMNVAVAGEDELVASFVIPLSTSAFVGVRELTRLLTLDTGELLLGKTYIAGLLSFIPTEWFEFKANYNYIRYVMSLEGVDPSLSGGMRSTFIGEALINFGMLGVIAVSYVFGMAVSAIDRWFAHSAWIRRHGMVGLVFGITIFHLGIIAFFENGSSAILFLLNRSVILWLLITVCFRPKRMPVESTRREAAITDRVSLNPG